MKTRSVVLMPVAAITLSIVCLAQLRNSPRQLPVWEVFDGQGFTGRSFSGPGTIPFQVRSLKVNATKIVQFRVDNVFNSDASGVLVAGGPIEVGNLTFLPRRACTGTAGGGCVVIPAGNWDSIIRFVRVWDFGVLPSGDNNSVYTVIGSNPPQPTPAPSHHRLSNAECRSSDSPPRNQAVYKIRRTADTNSCLAFDAGDPESVPINNCATEQKKLFTLIPASNGCWFIRNGDVRVPPAEGRCLHVETEDSNDLRAKRCDQTDQQFWKLFKKDGRYNLINQRSGKCLDRDSNGDGVHMVDCNSSEWQWWSLDFVRAR
jgi:hypothetical protein